MHARRSSDPHTAFDFVELLRTNFEKNKNKMNVNTFSTLMNDSDHDDLLTDCQTDEWQFLSHEVSEMGFSLENE